MSTLEKSTENNIYLSVIDGTLRQSVPEGTVDAVKRDWEAGGKSGTKWELVYKATVGKIQAIDIYEGEKEGKKFQNLNIVLDENENGKIPVISVGLKSRYADDLLKKLPNVDLDEEVRFRPYSFQPDGEDRKVIGVELTQRNGVGQFENKVMSHFSKKVGDKWEALNGYPVPEGDTSTYSSDDWDIFYKQARKFMVAYLMDNVIPKLESKTEEDKDTPKANPWDKKEEEEIDPENIPF